MEIGLEVLRKISLLIAVSGTAGLLFWSLILEPEDITVSEIGEMHIGKKVRLTGIVKGIYSTPDFVRFSLKQKDSIQVVIFNPVMGTRVLLENNRLIAVSGKVAEYKGELEIIAERVEGID